MFVPVQTMHSHSNLTLIIRLSASLSRLSIVYFIVYLSVIYHLSISYLLCYTFFCQKKCKLWNFPKILTFKKDLCCYHCQYMWSEVSEISANFVFWYFPKKLKLKKRSKNVVLWCDHKMSSISYRSWDKCKFMFFWNFPKFLKFLKC